MVDVVLVDFGGTLADETFMRRNCERFPSWSTDYVAVVDELRDDWDTGRLSSRQIATHVAARVGGTPDDARRYMDELCRSLTLYPAINAALARRRARGQRQALVTVNPDLFDTIALHYSLRDQFDAIVASWEYGTDSKVELCRHALDLFGGLHPADSILIDDITDHVNAWVSCGGRGYVFRDDRTFVSDVLDGQVPGLIAADVASEAKAGDDLSNDSCTGPASMEAKATGTASNRRWRHQATNEVFANSRLQVFEDTVLQPDGSESSYTVVEDRAGSVTIVAVTNDGRFVFVEQHRYPVDAMMLELPGGELAHGQNAVEQAATELADETGIVADRVQVLGEYVPWSARARRRCVAVLATGLDLSGLAVHKQDGDEAIHRVHLLTEADVKRLIAAGEIIDGNALCALSIHWAILADAGPRAKS